ncbi:MAG: stage II sporulation protein P [Oscillospiraceae bacterium]|nr:stage II sporulation protein P [Oscillospiraceae bacterium]
MLHLFNRLKKRALLALLLVLPVGLALLPAAAWRSVGLGAAMLARPAAAVDDLSRRLLLSAGLSAGLSDSSPDNPAAPAADMNIYPSDQHPAAGAPAPAEDGTGGTVITEDMSVQTGLIDGAAVRNKTGLTIDCNTLLQGDYSLGFEKNGTPEVLIIHTHTTEAYITYDTGYYNAADVDRSFDERRNVVTAGNQLAATLQAAGIGVIHDTTVFDNPVYTGAYDRSAVDIARIVQENPTIKLVIDLHRDTVMPNAVTRYKPTTTVNGRSAAQLMLVTGVLSTDALPNPYWQDNLRFSLHLQQALHAQYPTLTRPVDLTTARYNQQYNRVSVLIELGADANTVGEAVYTASLLGGVIAGM